MTPREKKEHEDLMLKMEQQNAKTDYIAMMTDVDIPDVDEVVDEVEEVEEVAEEVVEETPEEEENA